MNLWRYLTNKSYRKHRWAVKHLCEYRGHFEWLLRRRWRRVINGMYSKMTMPILIDMMHTEKLKHGDTIKIPKIGKVCRF